MANTPTTVSSDVMPTQSFNKRANRSIAASCLYMALQ
jgi:hypothetical protein